MVLDQKTCSLVRCLLCAICYIASLTALTACSYTEFRLFYDLRNQVKACLVLREAPRSHLHWQRLDSFRYYYGTQQVGRSCSD